MREIYLDNAATTKVEKKVADAVMKAFDDYGNPSSQHDLGKIARKKLEQARKEIAKSIGAKAEEIIFTSGGTESDNFAIRGVAKANPEKKHIITSIIEHPAVIETCLDLEENGYNIDYIDINKDGIVRAEDIRNKIRDDTLLVSIMHVNNEVGTIQPIEEIAKICREKNVYFHTDAVQSFCKLNINVSKMKIDLLSVSGHKVHAPKGIGFLYVKDGVKIAPILTGGGQQGDLRSGTENMPLAVGLAEAIKIKSDKARIKKIRNEMLKEILKISGARLNGSKDKRVYNNINVSFYGIEGESLMLKLNEDGIFVSTGSACASSKLEESYVLRAIDEDPFYLHGSIRITLDKINERDAKFVVDRIKKHVKDLSKISPFKLKTNAEKENEKTKKNN